MPEYLLEMNGVCKAFPGVQALQDAALKLRPGTVHALMGENGAGKSTLMKCLFGIYNMDQGEILYNGQPIKIANPFDALGKGIAMVHQELQPIPDRSIAENIYCGRLPKSMGGILVNHEKLYADTRVLLDRIGMDFDPHAKLGTLSVSQMQLVEIAKAISADARIVIMDEPTSSLTLGEVEKLFGIIDQLRKDGRAIIYISHKMDEILRIADEVTIMRDGQYIGTWPASELTTDKIITRMVGREMTNLYPPKENVPGEVIFETDDFTSIHDRSFRNISFQLRRGEILGVSGLVGAQRTELMEGIFGLRAHKKGEVRYKGQTLKIKRPQDAICRHIALLTEDRRRTGIFGVLSVTDNVAVASLRQYLYGGIMLNEREIASLVEDNINKLSIKTPSGKTLIKSLSGGNQQKVIVSRWLANDPDVFIMDEPTRGIDVGAKYEIYSIIADLARQGKSIIMISSEMQELIGMADRIMVMCDGKVTGFVERDTMNQETIMELATRFA
ncbi:MAG: sugar ABC transporter ATP-binding protein [Christensenellaceae bacterium]|jgi:methyl-galactoside transport system ATP-binding protein|nr:sugar ABC transporter ATP-binding protein [Christensenellaceae bacterium]